jgi:hypothetical protein
LCSLLDAVDQAQLYSHLCATVQPSTIGGVLSAVERECDDFYKRYLHDFVRLAHRCKHKCQEEEDQEYEVSTLM